MTTTTVPTMTPCPAWCQHDLYGDEDSHVGYLASAAGPREYAGHSVQLARSTDPETTDEAGVVVWIRGNDARHDGTPFTVAELLDLSAMFARAAVALEAVER